MTKQGYLIAKNSLKDTFFTSSSSYDRPTFVVAEKATRYLTVELAESALKKLLRNGTFTARLVPINEAVTIELPDEKQQLPQDPNAQDMDTTADPNGDPQPDDEPGQMVAQDQSGDPNAPPEGDGNPEDDDINIEVDQLLGNNPNQTDDLSDEQSTDGQQMSSGTDDELDDEDQDQDEDQDPNQLPPDQAVASNREDDLDGLDQLAVGGNAPVGEAALAMTPITSISAIDSSPVANGDDEKVKVPADILSALKAVKAEYEKSARHASKSDDAQASFCLTVVSAMDELYDLLKQGTVTSIKMAQVKLTSLMSPIMHLVPDNVVKFIHLGGRKQTLKDLFDAKRFK